MWDLRQGQQEFMWYFIHLFIFLSVFSGFYIVGGFFSPSFNLSQCSFPTYSFSLFPPTLTDFPFSLILSMSCFLPPVLLVHMKARKCRITLGLYTPVFCSPTAKYFLLSFHTYERCEGKKDNWFG